jgi:dCMP deaminase
MRMPRKPEVVTTTWAPRFMALARVVATWSKDPSTQVGAVIIDADRHIVSTGYNGFPAGVDDDIEERFTDRDVKLAMTVHAEVNAVLFAGRRLDCCLLVTTTFPCARCMGVILQSGIRVILCPDPDLDARLKREPWEKDHQHARAMMREAGAYFIAQPAEETP